MTESMSTNFNLPENESSFENSTSYCEVASVRHQKVPDGEACEGDSIFLDHPPKKDRHTGRGEARWLGAVNYIRGLKFQEFLDSKISQDPDQFFILGLEHPLVATLGKRASSAEIISPDVEGHPEIPVVHVQRGGHATLHLPGQLVIYPIVHLQRMGWGVRQYVELLLQTSAKTLAHFGVPTQSQQAGLFTNAGKIVSCGIRVKKNISTHGLAMNINNSLDLFSQIKTCGVNGQAMDSLKNQIQKEIPLQDVFQVWINEFNKVLEKTEKSEITEKFDGLLAQLVARFLDMEKVTGSSPVETTI